MPDNHGILTPAELAERQELRDRVQERQRIDAEQDAALQEYRDGPTDRAPTVPLWAVLALLCVVLIVAVVVL